MKAIVVFAIAFLAICSACSNKAFAPFGCCPDNKTPRNGYHNEGCGVKLCIDESVSDCEKATQSQCHTSRTIYKKCHYKCNPECRKSPSARCTSLHGCCWNGLPKQSPNSKCPECIDNVDFSHICDEYKDVSAGCNSGSLGIRSFLENHCPFTCKLCSK